MAKTKQDKRPSFTVFKSAQNALTLRDNFSMAHYEVSTGGIFADSFLTAVRTKRVRVI